MGPVITTNSLTKKYKDKTVVSQLDLRIPGGAFMAFSVQTARENQHFCGCWQGCISPVKARPRSMGKRCLTTRKLKKKSFLFPDELYFFPTTISG